MDEARQVNRFIIQRTFVVVAFDNPIVHHSMLIVQRWL